jgi:hypothetical protein
MWQWMVRDGAREVRLGKPELVRRFLPVPPSFLLNPFPSFLTKGLVRLQQVDEYWLTLGIVPNFIVA